MFEMKSDAAEYACKIMVIGVGGAGNNALNRMVDVGIRGVELMAVNTDLKDLRSCKAPNYVQIGQKLTKGLGAGADPERGEKAAEESIDEIKSRIEGYDMVFITCGMGGGTGTGAAPVIARTAKEMGILTTAIVTKPFGFESRGRMKKAEMGIAKLAESVDTYTVIPNDKLRALDPKLPFEESFKKADEVLQQSVQGITDLITGEALMNVDFADVRTTMHDKGIAHIGMGTGKGENRAMDAVKKAVENPLLDTKINGAKNLIYNITGHLTNEDVFTISEFLNDLIYDEADVIFGTDQSADVEDDAISVTVIATGLQEVGQEKPRAQAGSGMYGNQQNQGMSYAPQNPFLSGNMRPVAPQTDNVQVLGTGTTASLGGGMGTGFDSGLGAGSGFGNGMGSVPGSGIGTGFGSGMPGNQGPQQGGQPSIPPRNPAASSEPPVTLNRVEPRSINIPDFLKRH